MKYLGLDYGAKRIGVALSDDSGKLAFPHATLSNDGTLLEEIKRICHEFNINEIVIGESKNLSGEPNDIMKAIKRFADKVRININLPIHYEDEFMTSRQAARYQGEHEALDASSAALILQSFLDRNNSNLKKDAVPAVVSKKPIDFDHFKSVEMKIG